MDENLKQAADVGAVATTIGTVTGYLPSIAALVAIIWTVIRIYETQTVQSIVRKALAKRNTKQDKGD